MMYDLKPNFRATSENPAVDLLQRRETKPLPTDGRRGAFYFVQDSKELFLCSGGSNYHEIGNENARDTARLMAAAETRDITCCQGMRINWSGNVGMASTHPNLIFHRDDAGEMTHYEPVDADAYNTEIAKIDGRTAAWKQDAERRWLESARAQLADLEARGIVVRAAAQIKTDEWGYPA